MKKRTKPTKKRHVWQSGEFPGVPYGQEVTLMDVLALLPIEVLEIINDQDGYTVLDRVMNYKQKKG